MSTQLVTLIIVAAVGSGIVGGVFFAFSTFVMKALDRLPASQSVSAMQAINKAAPNGWFMAALFGTAFACIALGIAAIVRWGKPGAPYLLIGSAIYLITVIVTMAYHVPRNNGLAVVDPNGVDAARHWAAYSPAWTAWNHVRTIGSIAAATVLTIGLRIGQHV
jgi:uncharacterized membrane protein